MKLVSNCKLVFLTLLIMTMVVFFVKIQLNGRYKRTQINKQHWLGQGIGYKSINDETRIPLIYIITPTKHKNEQKADLTRLSQTLRLVKRIHWIIVEDRDRKSDKMKTFLNGCALNYTHLATETNHTKYKLLQEEGKIGKNSKPAKGIQQRNLALDWITEHGEYPSVFFFADDDNTYDIRLFEEMRYTKRVSVWPVGLAASARFETPVVTDGMVVGVVSGWIGRRKFPLDMAAFAVNSEILKRPNPPRFGNNVKIGFAETNFIEQLNVTIEELEPKAENCTKVLVWHTRTRTSSMRATASLERRLAIYNLTQFDVEI